MTTLENKKTVPAAGFPGDVPSKAKLLKATGVALLVAAVIFFTVVLPAEYGIDPLHTGAALGLMNLSKANGAPAAGAEAQAPAAQEIPAPVIIGVFTPQPKAYKVDSRELKLQGGEGIEIKYHMEKGAAMVYSWTASSTVRYEFHGEPDIKPAGSPEDYFESYDNEMRKGSDHAHGSFTSPSAGIEGWFWDNTSDNPVTIKLVTAGFYDYIWQNKDDVKTRLTPSAPP